MISRMAQTRQGLKAKTKKPCMKKARDTKKKREVSDTNPFVFSLAIKHEFRIYWASRTQDSNFGFALAVRTQPQIT